MVISSFFSVVASPKAVPRSFLMIKLWLQFSQYSIRGYCVQQISILNVGCVLTIAVSLGDVATSSIVSNAVSCGPMASLASMAGPVIFGASTLMSPKSITGLEPGDPSIHGSSWSSANGLPATGRSSATANSKGNNKDVK